MSSFIGRTIYQIIFSAVLAGIIAFGFYVFGSAIYYRTTFWLILAFALTVRFIVWSCSGGRTEWYR